MTKDLAAYRTVGPVDAEVIKAGSGELWVRLKRDVGEILSIEGDGVPLQIAMRPSKSILILQGDVSEEGLKAIREVSILAEIDPTEGRHLMVPNTLGFGTRLRRIGGRESAIQRSVRWLLMDRGSDVWHPEAGGGLRTAIRGLLVGGDLTEITRYITFAVDRYNNQSTPVGTSTGWRVRSIDLLSVKAIPPTTEVLPYNAADPTQRRTIGEPALGVTFRHTLYNRGQTETISTTVVL